MKRVFTEEHRRNLSLAHKGQIPTNLEQLRQYRKGRPLTEEHKEKIRLGNLGKSVSKSSRLKMSRAKKGKPSWNKGKKLSESHSAKARVAMLGKKHSEETKRKMSLAHSGSKNHLWKGGITPIHAKIRNSREYKLWRAAVFERDNFTCVWCGSSKSGTLNADHIKPFALFPELRFAIDNGRTLCVPCHKKTDSYLNRWLGSNYK
jgi:5-methylcytosine-specific restriction endonuclease McrA